MEHHLEALCKAKEEARQDREDKRKAHDHLFNEWEQMDIQQLSNALNTETNELRNMIFNPTSLL